MTHVKIHECIQVLFLLARFAKAHEEDPSEEKETSKGGYAMGLTMIGLLVLLSWLFALTKSRHQETREVTWRLVSNTISIFVAVTFFSFGNDLVSEYLAISSAELHVKIWLIDMHVTKFRFTQLVNRIWVFFWYAGFVVSLSFKANMLRPDYRRVVIKIHKVKHAVANLPSEVMPNNLKRSGSDGSLSVEHTPVSGLQRALQQQLLADDFDEADEVAFQRHANYMHGSVLWAHAMGFAAMEGWGLSQNYECAGQPRAEQLFTSLRLILQVGAQTYLLLRFIGIFWRWCMELFVEPKSYRIQIDRDGDYITEGFAGEPAEFVMHRDGRSRVWFQSIDSQCIIGRDGKFHGIERLGPGGEPPNYSLFEAPSKFRQIYRVHLTGYGPCRVVKDYDDLVDLWDEHRTEGENDYFALMNSFVIVQTLRLWIGGNLPDEKGDEEVTYLFDHLPADIGRLYFASVVFFFFSFFKPSEFLFTEEGSANEGSICGRCITGIRKKCCRCFAHFECHLLHADWERFVERLSDIFTDTFLMSGSWCMMYALQWLLAKSRVSQHDPAVLAVLLAICVTALCFFWMSILPFLRASKAARGGMSKGLAKLLMSSGLLIGFSWEGAFDIAVEHISEAIEDKVERQIFELFIACAVGFAIIPVWWQYIIPMSEEHGYMFGFVPRHAQHRLKGLLSQFAGADDDPGRSDSERRETVASNFKHHHGHFLKMKNCLNDLTRLNRTGHVESRKEHRLSVSSNRSHIVSDDSDIDEGLQYVDEELHQ